MNPVHPVNGVFCLVSGRDYQAWTDSDGKARPGGTTYTLFVIDSGQMLTVKVPAPAVGQLTGFELGDRIAFTADVRPVIRGGRAQLEYVFEGLTEVTSA
jgi:hypothetical protein